jgi:serine/threonine-protein kinase RsbW
MGVQERYLVSPAELIQHRAAGAKGYDDAVVVFRTTLMNPFTLAPARGSKDYIHLFLETLLPLLRKARRTLDISAPLCIAARLESLADIRRFVRDRATVLDVDPATIADLVLAVDEAATNVITHGYQGQEGIVEIEVRREGNAVIAQVRDEAKPFDPTAAPPPDLTLPPEERAMEGMGIYMMRRNTDEMSHRLTLQRGNELTLVKRGIGT